jgi:uncharacterized protein YcbK (DUF882 family)
MRTTAHSNPQPPGTRRAFLRSAVSICGLVGVAAVVPGLVRAAPGRMLSFLHTHTGESLTIPYRTGSCYEAGCLEAVNHLLRDFRTGDVHRIDPGLLDILCALKERTDSDAPFQVISGYRSPRTNTRLRGGSQTSGVAERSLHLEGQAIDVRLGGVRTPRLAELARGLQGGGVGYYKSSDFVHVDTGRVRHW